MHFLSLDLFSQVGVHIFLLGLTHALNYCTSKTPDNGTCKAARMEKLAKKLREKTPIGIGRVH